LGVEDKKVFGKNAAEKNLRPSVERGGVEPALEGHKPYVSSKVKGGRRPTARGQISDNRAGGKLKSLDHQLKGERSKRETYEKRCRRT